MDSLSLIAEIFAPVSNKALLDVGCGSGLLSRALAAHGARATGIDPNESAIAAARVNAPQASFHVASAERLPLIDHSFDGVIFLNSLHHIPGMDAALREAKRAVRADGAVIVIEPLARGSFFSAFLPLEDETAVRRKAQESVEAALRSGLFRLIRVVEFNRRETFDGLDPFLERISAADPKRESLIRKCRDSLQSAFEAASLRNDEGRYVLDQPLRAHALAPGLQPPGDGSARA